MTEVVTFDYDTWVALYPEFAACTPTQGQAWFNRSGVYFANDACNPVYIQVNNLSLFSQFVYMLTSHIAWLSAPRDANGIPAASGAPAPGVVGRISSASEGSVSVSTEWKGSGSPSEDWYLQTQYGAAFWAATAPYRTAIYMANPTFVAGPIFPFVPDVLGGFGGWFGRRR